MHIPAPTVKTGDYVGFLIDFVTPEHNGCVRIFHNGIEVCDDDSTNIYMNHL